MILELTLSELGAKLGGRVEGDGRTVIRGVNGIAEATEGQLTFLSNGKYARALAQTRASAVILAHDGPARPPIPALRVEDPDLAFALAAQILCAGDHPYAPKLDGPPEIHPTAVVAPSARIGRGARIGACAVVEPEADIGEQTVVYPHAYVGHKVRIGARCLIYPQVVIREGCVLGNRVIVQPGAVIGSDGFGYVTARDGRIVKIPQLGIVVIEDDVEIGANTTIDRARVDRTIVRRGTKIDNLVQIAHNVSVGEQTLIAAQTGIAGSAKIGNRVWVGGQVGLQGHIEIGDGSKIGAQAGVTKSFGARSVLWGTPARAHRETLREQAMMRRVPELLEKIRSEVRATPAKNNEKSKKDDRKASRG